MKWVKNLIAWYYRKRNRILRRRHHKLALRLHEKTGKSMNICRRVLENHNWKYEAAKVSIYRGEID